MSKSKSNVIPKYVAMIVLCACVHLFAENNPFNLQDNLQKIDEDQDALLSELKKLSIKHNHKSLEKNTGLTSIETQEQEKAKLLKLHEKQIEAEKHKKRLFAEQEKLKKDLEKREFQKAKEALERREVEAYEAERLAKKDTAIVHIDILKEEKSKQKNADQEYLKAIAAVK